MAIGLDGMKRATIIGSRMAGLLGAVYTYTLPRSGIRYNLPGDRLTHVDGTPRETFVPSDLVEDTAEGGDAVLARALAVLRYCCCCASAVEGAPTTNNPRTKIKVHGPGVGQSSD